MIHALLLLSLFHHNHAKQDVLRFTHAATGTLASYQDGSPQSWLEAQRIADIAVEIDLLNRHPKRKDADRLEHIITDNIARLHDYDQALQKQMLDLQGNMREI